MADGSKDTPGGAVEKHSLLVTLLVTVPVGAAIGVVDVLYVAPVWPMLLAQFAAAFITVWFLPTRWISTAFSLSVMVWLAYFWVRSTWWDHPDELDPHDYAAAFAALSAFAGAIIAARIQVRRGVMEE